MVSWVYQNKLKHVLIFFIETHCWSTDKFWNIFPFFNKEVSLFMYIEDTIQQSMEESKV